MKVLPKIIISIPIIVVAIAIFLRTDEKKANVYVPQNPEPEITSTQSDEPTPINSFPEGQDTKNNLNLIGPFICGFKDKDMSVDFQIKNKNIFGKIDKNNIENNFLIKDDCLYTWETGKYRGEKICEIGQYLSIFELASSFMSSDALFSTMLGAVPNMNISEQGISTLVNSCKKNEVDTKNFILPENIIFKTGSLEQIGKQLNDLKN